MLWAVGCGLWGVSCGLWADVGFGNWDDVSVCYVGRVWAVGYDEVWAVACMCAVGCGLWMGCDQLGILECLLGKYYCLQCIYYCLIPGCGLWAVGCGQLGILECSLGKYYCPQCIYDCLVPALRSKMPNKQI